MKEPLWVKIDVLIAMHKEIIAEHGGIEGIRDNNLLESSCSAPMQLFHYSNPKPSIPELAARFVYSAKNHPFQDGNKRMSAIACEIFLELNDHILTASDEDAYFIFVDLAAGNISENELIEWIKKNSISPLQ